MNSIILDSVDIILGSDTTSQSFKEFCDDLDELDKINDENFYIEAVQDNNVDLRHGLKAIRRNTRNTTLDVGAAYGNIVSGNAKLIKSVWDLTMRAINLSTRVIGFILRKLSLIPRVILDVGNKVADLPEDIRNKIRGNIQLYITVNDIQNLYNKQLLVKIDKFISLARRLSEGEVWGTAFKKRKTEGIIKMKENDMAICRQMDEIYEQIKLLEFKPSTVEMKDQKSVEMYFGNKAVVAFKDLHAKSHNSTYYEALIQLMKDISEQKDTLEKIHGDIGAKYTQSQLNSSFSQLNFNAQNRVASTIQMMSKIVSVIGNIIRYITIDMKTLETATDTLLAKQGVTATKKTSAKK